MKLLNIFSHGLGDAVQFTSVLKHLKRHNPDTVLHVASTKGKISCFNGLAEKIFLIGQQYDNHYDKVINYRWPENYNCYHDYPSTKTVKCIAEELRLPTVPELLKYTINVSQHSVELVEKYIATLPINKGYVLIHYQGNTATGSKNISIDVIKKLCEFLIISDYSPVILDWDFRSPLPDGKKIFCPNVHNPLWKGYGTGDAEVIAALINKAKLLIAIDSGILHVGMSTETPTIGVWIRHHPLHFADLANNTVHLIPHDHANYIRGDKKSQALEYFKNSYNSMTYSNLDGALVNLVNRMLNGAVPNQVKDGDVILYGLKSKSYDKNYYEEHRISGLDYLSYGDWQKEYGQWITDVFQLKNKSVLDIGTAAGSILNGIQEASACKAYGIDKNNYTINLGRENFKNLDLEVCDACNIHFLPDNSLDFVHSHQVMEHIHPNLVPLVMDEVYRVLKLNGYFLAIFDSEELFIRQKRTKETDDPTHVCIKPLKWWYAMARSVGFEVIKDMEKFKDHDLSYFKKYDWDYFICKKSENSMKNKLYI